MTAIREQLGKLEARDWLQLIAVVGLGLGFLFARVSSEATTNSSIKQLTENVQSLSASVKEMDQQGTRGSQLAIQILAGHETDDQRRITNLEQQMAQLVPKVTEMSTKLDIITALLDKKNGK